ncbi:MAG TPA: cupin domain-containing protein [Pseudonocardiaceae bacterium]|jgi:mannose-6-phosphate isomerase-like protein (cupin superfamily)
MSINLVGPGDGEELELGPSRIRILEDGSHTGHRLGMAVMTLAPGFAGPPQHLHRKHEETFFVTSGTMQFISGTDQFTVGAGSLVTVPIGTPHTFGNLDPDEPATLLFTTTPDLYINYFRDLVAIGTGDVTPDKILEVMEKYATEPFQP